LAKQEHRITVHVAFHYVAWQLRNIWASKKRDSFFIIFLFTSK
jgi:hypothetical protein